MGTLEVHHRTIGGIAPFDQTNVQDLVHRIHAANSSPTLYVEAIFALQQLGIDQ